MDYFSTVPPPWTVHASSQFEIAIENRVPCLIKLIKVRFVSTKPGVPPITLGNGNPDIKMCFFENRLPPIPIAYHHCPMKPWSFEGYAPFTKPSSLIVARQGRADVHFFHFTWWKILSRDCIQYRLYVIVYVFVCILYLHYNLSIHTMSTVYITYK